MYVRMVTAGAFDGQGACWPNLHKIEFYFKEEKKWVSMKNWHTTLSAT